jgi:hypothetical protein
VYVTADCILAAYLHSANGVDDGSSRGFQMSWPLDAATPVISLFAHLDPVLNLGSLL